MSTTSRRSFLRARSAILLGFVLFAGCRAEDRFVSAPMVLATDAGAPDAEASPPDLPREPVAPNGCSAESECVPEDAQPLVFTAPFERCPPTIGKSPMRFFSAKTTLAQRKREDHVCCYLRYDCSIPQKSTF